MGAIAGTALAVWNPGVRQSTTTAQITSPQQIMAVSMMGGAGAQVNVVTTLRSGREISALTPKIKALTQGHTDLVPGIFVSDLDSGDFYTLNGSNTFSAASMIKVPILIAFFQDVDAGKIRLDEVLTVEKGDVAGGSGDMQFDPVGSKHTALETARLMIVISDNTATNMLIRRMGGIEVLNHRFRSWGLQQTVIRDILPDLKGTNTTSPKELVSLLNAVSQGQLISMKSRDRALQIMRQTETDTLLPTSLGEGATIAHKTGDIGSLVGDTGLVDLPSGKRYIVTALVKRPHNDERAQELIRQMARVIYEHFDQGRSVSPQPQPQENQPQEDQPQSEEQSQ
jgi:beta-lactamase class A